MNAGEDGGCQLSKTFNKDDKFLVCTHATFRFADKFELKLMVELLQSTVPHVSANPENKLGHKRVHGRDKPGLVADRILF